MQPQITRRTLPDDAEATLPDLHPLLRRLFLARSVRDRGEVGLELGWLLPPTHLQGVEQAAELLAQALEEGRKILVVGDYDADGATSCALTVRVLRAFGAQRVDYLVPNRFDVGYGLSPQLAEQAAREQPDILLTVDNGISSLSGVERAAQLGMEVIVTDHHLAGERLPAARAIVNPNQPGDRFPSKHLAGVGVVFYLLSVLRGRLRGVGWFARRGITEPSMADWLDLVALGTVADLVPLDRNNRILVQQGLMRIRAGRCCAGITALLQVAGRRNGRVTSADLGFVVGPRLNAAGRLQDMAFGVECLLTDDPGRALEQAATLDELNRERRRIESGMKEQAEALLARLGMATERLPLGLCLFDERWHQGVIGILASRLKERYHRPVVALAADGERLKGSARSISGLHIRDALAAVDSRHPGLIERFGGHAMAAGLTLPRTAMEAFAVAFDREVAERLDGRAPRAELLSDGALSPAELNLETARLLRYAAPWGQGFPPPLFDGEFEILSRRPVGEVHLKLRLRPAGGGPVLDAMAFRWGEREPPEGSVRIAYRLDLNEYLGREQPQLIVEHLEALEGG